MSDTPTNPDLPIVKALLHKPGGGRAPWRFVFNWAGVYTLQQMSDSPDPIDKLIADIKSCVNTFEPDVVWDWLWAFSYQQRQEQYESLTYRDFLAMIPVGDEFLKLSHQMFEGIMKILPKPKKKSEQETNTQEMPLSVGTKESMLQPQS